MPQPTTVFVSYCRRDRRWLERLKVHLTPYDRRGDLDLWDDTKIDAGDLWRAGIADAIERAAASVVLVSADFLASDFVATHELPKLLHKAERAGTRILPVFVEPCELSNHPELASFQGVNTPQKPLAEMTRVEAERVLVRTAEAIGKILESHRTRSTDRKDERGGSGAPTGSSVPDLFDELHAATLTLAIVSALANTAGDFTLTELEQRLSIRSRKRAYAALNRLVAAGWIEKIRVSALTKYHLTSEGARQLQRLIEASDGPVRRGHLPG
jgi:hypothetical protein